MYAVSSRPETRIARGGRVRLSIALAVVLGALIVPSAALARPFTSNFYAPTHTPKVGGEHIKVTAFKNGTPLCGTVSYVFYFNGQLVARQRAIPGKFCHGVYRDTLMWPKRAIGYKLTLGVVIKTRYGTDYDWYWIRVRR